MALTEAQSFLKQGTYPIVTLEKPFVDARGIIQNLTTEGAQSVAVIHSQIGSERASHVHKTDDHLSYVVSGLIEYWWQHGQFVIDDCDLHHEKWEWMPTGEKRSVVVGPGQAFYTPPGVAHTMYFRADTVFVTVSCKQRDTKHHEADLIRVPSLKDR